MKKLKTILVSDTNKIISGLRATIDEQLAAAQKEVEDIKDRVRAINTGDR